MPDFIMPEPVVSDSHDAFREEIASLAKKIDSCEREIRNIKNEVGLSDE